MVDHSKLTGGVDLFTLPTPGLGNRSYVMAADGWAVAVDVPRDFDRVGELLDRNGLRLAGVLETHVHNDYLTGGLALARGNGATYVVPAGPELAFEAERSREWDAFDFGPLTIRVIGSAGHTDAHVVYSAHLFHAPALAAFTGGSLLFGGVGRTDLLGPDRAETLARAQYWSIRRLARLLPGRAEVLPTHGFGSYCRAASAASAASAAPPQPRGTTVADQLEVNPAFLTDEETFVARITGRPRPIPRYFPAMAPRNQQGVEPPRPNDAQRWPLERVRAWAHDGGWVLDVRSRAEHAAAHLPGSLNVDGSGALATWAGWLLPIDDPVVLVAGTAAELQAAVRELTRIGIDHIEGAHVGPLAVRRGLQRRNRVGFADVAAAQRANGAQLPLLDVRDADEWREGHLRGALRIPAEAFEPGTDLPADLPEDSWVYCGSGFRAAVVASVIERQGGSATLIDGPITAARRSGVAWCSGDGCDGDACLAAAPWPEKTRHALFGVRR